jgi:site-specific recombinase XerC
VCEHDIKGTPRFLGIRNKALIMLFLDSGLRLKEMATLTVSDVNLTEQYVSVLGKGNKPDFCPFFIYYFFTCLKRTTAAFRFNTQTG